uniref:C2H2-type domain-containing protein n=1 Tax=Amphilophus citrinellus TaxID=61819 RepID=A0A3Q0RV74_AMPCI
ITHSGEKPYICNTCGERFCYLLALKKHKAVHTGENPVSCTTCGKTFTQRGSLLVHMRIHSGEKPYSCKTCGKSFTKKCTLLVHVRIHTGEKPYTCKVCGKSFTQRGGLVVHMKTHAGEKPYPCKTCGKKFTRSKCPVANWSWVRGQTKSNSKDPYGIVRIGLPGPHPGARRRQGAQGRVSGAWPGAAQREDMGPPSCRPSTHRRHCRG